MSAQLPRTVLPKPSSTEPGSARRANHAHFGQQPWKQVTLHPEVSRVCGPGHLLRGLAPEGEEDMKKDTQWQWLLFFFFFSFFTVNISIKLVTVHIQRPSISEIS